MKVSKSFDTMQAQSPITKAAKMTYPSPKEIAPRGLKTEQSLQNKTKQNKTKQQKMIHVF